MRQKDNFDRQLVFTRGVCDELLSFVFNGRSTYVAATSHFSATKKSFSMCRQYINILGRMFVAMLQPCPEAFKCPLCGDNPEFIILDGQSIGFRARPGMNIVRPSLLVPVLPIGVELLCVIPTATRRRAVRKILRCADRLSKTELASLRSWRSAQLGTQRRRRNRGRVNTEIFVDAAELFHTFFLAEDGRGNQLESDGESSSSTCSHAALDSDTGNSQGASSDGGGGDAPGQATARTADDRSTAVPKAHEEPVASSSSQWHSRTGPYMPSFECMAQSDFMGWSAVRTFLLAALGDPVVGMFQGVNTDPIAALAVALQSKNPEAWHCYSAAADAVGFVSNFLTRTDEHLKANEKLRKSLGRVLEFIVELESIIDEKFKDAATKAAQKDTGLNRIYCDRWGGRPTAADFKRFAAEHPGFKGKDLDSAYTCFEYFGNLPRIRPAISALKARRRKRAAAGRPRVAARKRRHSRQAEEEDDNDRCNKEFPNHPDLTAGVFNVVCPHVVTLGFRVMFDAESVSEALSVILERFPKLPKVVFYDVGCKLDRNALRRVRSIFNLHGVKVVLDRVHAKGHTCSPIFFPNEALGLTNGVATQAAEVQHSVSVKFRSHLAYMSPESFMAHRIVQLSLMNLVASYKLLHPHAKEENQDASMADFYHSFVAKECCRSRYCACPASRQVVPF